MKVLRNRRNHTPLGHHSRVKSIQRTVTFSLGCNTMGRSVGTPLKIEFSSEKFVGLIIKKDVPKVYDYADFSILSYPIDNILSEKMRTILQRGKLRDYYDVWKLLKTTKFRPDYIRDMFAKKCQTKGVDFSEIDQFFPQNLADNLKNMRKLV